MSLLSTVGSPSKILDPSIEFTRESSTSERFTVKRSQLISPEGKLDKNWRILSVVKKGIASILEERYKMDEDQVSRTIDAYTALCSGSRRDRALFLSAPTDQAQYGNLAIPSFAAVVENLQTDSLFFRATSISSVVGGNHLQYS
jgi:hypothetical protein